MLSRVLQTLRIVHPWVAHQSNYETIIPQGGAKRSVSGWGRGVADIYPDVRYRLDRRWDQTTIATWLRVKAH